MRLNRATFTAAVLASLFRTFPAGAAEPRPKVAIPEVRIVGTFDPKAVAGISALIASEMAKHPVQVVAGADVAALLGYEREKQLAGCSEGSCLAEIGGALGADWLLSSEVSQVGNVWLLTLSMLDVAGARTVQRVTRQASSAGDLVGQVPAAADMLVAAMMPARAGDGPPVLGMTGWIVGGSGVAMLAGGTVFGVLAARSHREALNLARTNDIANLPRFEEVKSTLATQKVVADLLYAAGAAAAGLGLTLVLLGGTAKQPPVAVGASGGPGGLNLVVQGAF